MELMESGPSYSEDYSSSSDYPDYSSDLSEDYDDEDEDMDIEYEFKAPKPPKHGHYGPRHYSGPHHYRGPYCPYWDKNGNYHWDGKCDSEDSKHSADY